MGWPQCLQKFESEDPQRWNFFGSVDTDADSVTTDFQQGNRDVGANGDFFPKFSGQDEHLPILHEKRTFNKIIDLPCQCLHRKIRKCRSCTEGNVKSLGAASETRRKPDKHLPQCAFEGFRFFLVQ